jgi:hypothetical protein
MSDDDLQRLRSVLAARRAALVDRLVTDTTGIIEPGFLRLLGDTHSAIAAIDAELAEPERGAE